MLYVSTLLRRYCNRSCKAKKTDKTSDNDCLCSLKIFCWDK